ncbi:MAG: hypothetical protein JWN48_4864 [Myxococcaceae bacterium]|nr:hypothetical protein [Myxococcaceae bacterium]
MALRKFGFIVTGAQLAPGQNRVVMSSPAFEMIAVGVAKAEDGVEVARALVDEGIQLLELCGGFGPIWTAKIIAAIGGRIPVGAVAYGPESIKGMYQLFSD